MSHSWHGLCRNETHSLLSITDEINFLTSLVMTNSMRLRCGATSFGSREVKRPSLECAH